jgi:hypothetical protein
MDFDPSRLRSGELIVGASAILLLASMLALKWYGGAGRAPSVNGWHALTHLRWLILLTALIAVALILVQARNRAPAIPVSLSVIVTALGLLMVPWLAYRVLISSPAHQKAAAFLGLACSIGVALGGYLSLRREGLPPKDAPSEIETVRLGGSDGS